MMSRERVFDSMTDTLRNTNCVVLEGVCRSSSKPRSRHEVRYACGCHAGFAQKQADNRVVESLRRCIRRILRNR